MSLFKGRERFIMKKYTIITVLLIILTFTIYIQSYILWGDNFFWVRINAAPIWHESFEYISYKSKPIYCALGNQEVALTIRNDDIITFEIPVQSATLNTEFASNVKYRDYSLRKNDFVDEAVYEEETIIFWVALDTMSRSSSARDKDIYERLKRI